uniref:Uncharacterized protein n=2 Tax=Aegilops tauschii subsp. strangulata TaxID=200361 RepID=A0A453LZ07_AEGTS
MLLSAASNSLFILAFNLYSDVIVFLGICSLSAQKYFRRGTRLNWPEGAVTRESIRAVRKLHRLKQITLPYERPSQAVHLTFQSQGSCVGFCRY